ncbi:MAG: metallophosphoesterase family protein, partial [Acidimicrobiales bacterium]
TGVRCFVSGANDDFFEVDALLAQSAVVEDPNGRVVSLDNGIELLGMGYGNKTPWPCPRDVTEDELAGRINGVAAQLKDPKRSIMSLHVPPFQSTLDLAPRLDGELQLVMTAAGPEIAPAGSTAVRDALAQYQPPLGLHGHIHESKGIVTIGQTLAVNPGSEYGEAILDGVLVDLDTSSMKVRAQLVAG